MDRIARISGEMKRVLSDIIRNDLKDPRIPVITSITNVKLTRDLKYAKVYVSLYGTEEEINAALDCFDKSKGFIRKMIGQKMTIRCLPELTFIRDDSLEYGAYMSKRITELIGKDVE
ncbi:MAG: 30S ribosome-binding factor RbfA [Ruminococcaceae bacterium]|jgi:ribosome-binding factor A|nr:30S ribosome-binding factor RbfA [Oscillospiraceae bacterium]